jgi:hemerythrin-like domain-containing protein
MSPDTPNLAKDLVRIHKVITRGLDVVLTTGEGYLGAGFANPQELQGYSSYIHCLAAVLGAHHTGEDLIAFPDLRKVLPLAPYSQLAADHRWIEKLLAPIPQAINDLPGGSTESRLKKIIDNLANIQEIWAPHIRMEEQFFSQDIINSVMVIEEQKRISEATTKYSQEHSDPPYWVIPFILFNLEKEERETMASFLPPMIMEEMVPKVWKEKWEPMKPFLLD